MTTIILKQLAPQLVQRLQQQAELNGRSLEAEIVAILTRVLMPQPPKPQTEGLGTAIGKHFAHFGEFELSEVPREAVRNPPIE